MNLCMYKVVCTYSKMLLVKTMHALICGIFMYIVYSIKNDDEEKIEIRTKKMEKTMQPMTVIIFMYFYFFVHIKLTKKA